MDQNTKKFCTILNELEDAILDIASSFNIAILTTGDVLDKYYEDTRYHTNVIVHKDYTATVNQYKKADKDLPPDVDKDLIPESKCWDLSKREVSTYLAAIISPWFESYLSKMEKGIDTLFGLRVTCPSVIESLGLLKTAYKRGEEVFSEFKQKNDPLDFVGAFEMYLSCYCDVDEIGKRFEELQMKMGIELTGRNGGKVGDKKKPKKKSKIKGWIVFMVIILGAIWTCIQIYESQTFKSVLQKIRQNDNNQLKIFPPKMPNAPANYKKTSPSSQTKIIDPNRNSP